MTATGYLVPANTEVASSPTLPRTRRRARTTRSSSTPASATWSSRRFISDRVALDDAVTPLLELLVTAPGVLDLELTTEQIDEASPADPAPEEADPETPSETESPTESIAGPSGLRTVSGSSGSGAGSTSAAEDRPDEHAGSTSSTCHCRAPYAASWARTAVARSAGSRVGGGCHSRRRRKSGVSRFSTGRSLQLGEVEHRLAAPEAPGGDRVPVGPGAGERRAVAARRAGRQVVLGHREDLAGARRPSGWRSARRRGRGSPWCSGARGGRRASRWRRRRSRSPG